MGPYICEIPLTQKFLYFEGKKFVRCCFKHFAGYKIPIPLRTGTAQNLFLNFPENLKFYIHKIESFPKRDF
jgi:hypothetical protein